MVDNAVKYVIPKYQREYIWNKENWEELLNDIDEGDGHFIGSIICVNRGADALQPELELVDGQQRLTTISLLFCAIYGLLKDRAPENNEELNLELGNLKFRLVKKGEPNVLRIELSSQNNNFEDYQSIISDIGVREFGEPLRYRANRRIYKCYKFFKSRLEEYDTEMLTSLLKKINGTYLVKIEVDSHSDAFMLFESLNNRGIPLSAIDLIKNKMLAELASKETVTMEDAFNKWKTIVDSLSDYVIQERFLRQYYNAFKCDKKIKINNIARATRSNLIKIYETLIEKDPEFIFNKLRDNAVIYRDLTQPDNAVGEKYIAIKKELNDLINVKAAPSYTLLMYLSSRSNDLPVSSLRSIVNFLVNYFIRRNITDFPGTRNLDQIFIDLINELEEDEDAQSITHTVKQFLSDSSRMSSKQIFKEKLSGDIYDLNVDATRFILSKIEETKRTRESDHDFWERDRSNKLIWTIEHIFPEGRNIPPSWVDMIASGDKEEARIIRDEYTHKLGNLTLTGFNQKLSNFDFMKKRDRKDTSGNYIGYKNRLFLNDDLRDKSTWTKEDITTRTKKLVALALRIFKID